VVGGIFDSFTEGGGKNKFKSNGHVTTRLGHIFFSGRPRNDARQRENQMIGRGSPWGPGERLIRGGSGSSRRACGSAAHAL